MRFLAHWILSAIAILIVSQLVWGFRVSGLVAALIAALVIGLINGTLGEFLKIVTFPITIVTFGIFLLVINAAMLMLAAYFVPGFYVAGFWSAFWGAVVLCLLNMAISSIMKAESES